ncbi:hypothetical protein F5Y16DRAFT_403517 [Xylariaceae sp. FL0255]|nr:hypothetical protein F5Y16DRAFT_403517 [Xylariaceae sp. FL0255]
MPYLGPPNVVLSRAAGLLLDRLDDISGVLYMRDGGQTSNESLVPESTGHIHMTVVSLPNGKVPTQEFAPRLLETEDIAILFNDSSATANMGRREGLYNDITSSRDTRVNQPKVNGKTAIWGTPARRYQLSCREWRIRKENAGIVDEDPESILWGLKQAIIDRKL